MVRRRRRNDKKKGQALTSNNGSYDTADVSEWNMQVACSIRINTYCSDLCFSWIVLLLVFVVFVTDVLCVYIFSGVNSLITVNSWTRHAVSCHTNDGILLASKHIAQCEKSRHKYTEQRTRTCVVTYLHIPVRRPTFLHFYIIKVGRHRSCPSASRACQQAGPAIAPELRLVQHQN